MKLFAPAKINLCLKILGKRTDGYHNICTVMQTVSLYDEIHILKGRREEREKGRREGWIEFECVPAVTNSPEENLGYRAAALFKKYFGIIQPVKIKIVKKIPVRKGLGGGSSDAATILKGLLKFWQIGKNKLKTLHKLAIQLGADVPFFLYSGCCLAEGIGEKITQLETPWQKKPLWILLVIPEFNLSTKEVYSKYTPSLSPPFQGGDEVGVSPPWKGGDLERVNKFRKERKIYSLADVPFVNDLEKVAFEKYPELEKIKLKLQNVGAIASLMSGSGSAIYGIFDSKYSAQKAQRALNYESKILQTV